MRETETGEITNAIGRPTWEEKGSCSKQIGQENPEWKESFSTCLAQQILSPKNLLAIHYSGSVAKMFPLSRDVRSTHKGGLTCATEVQSSLLIYPGTWTAQCLLALSQGGNTSCMGKQRGDAEAAMINANDKARVLNKG